MTEVLIPPDIYPDEEEIELVDDGTTSFTPTLGKNVSQTQQSYEPRIRVVQRFKSLRGSDRARMIAALRGAGASTNYVRAQVGRVLRGSFPATELLTNNTFANGTTGWSVNASAATLSVADRVLRVTRASSAINPQADPSLPTITQYAPYALRGFFSSYMADITPSLKALLYASSTVSENAPSTATGLATTAQVATLTTPLQIAFYDSTTSGIKAGSYFDISYTSLTRCALVDNGQNLLTYSDQTDNAAWTKYDTTISANAATDPLGGSTADNIQETTATAAHYIASSAVTVSASAADYSLAFAVKGNGRTWAYLRMSEGTGASQVYQTFNLSTGAKGTTNSTGANWSNLRSFISPLGNDWYYVCIVARKTNAATALYAWVGPSDGDSVSSYTGTAGLGIRAWRGTLAQSSVPTRLVQTTSTTTSGTAQTGSSLYIKGLPASTSGLLLTDDVMEVNGELLQLTASLDSDAAGLAYAQFAPSMFRSPADNDPVIIGTPLPRMTLKGEKKWTNRLGVYSDFEIVMEQRLE